MNEEEKITLMDRVLQGLSKRELNTVAELIDGFQKYPIVNSEKDLKYRIIEQELLALDLVEIIGGGNSSKSINGYYYFEITTNGLKYVLENKSVKELYEIKKLKNDQDSRTHELTRKNLESKDKIRPWENISKIIELSRNFIWVIIVLISLVLFIIQLCNNA